MRKVAPQMTRWDMRGRNYRIGGGIGLRVSGSPLSSPLRNVGSRSAILYAVEAISLSATKGASSPVELGCESS